MKLTTIIVDLVGLVGVATAAAVATSSHGKDPTAADLERAKAQCSLLPPAHRDVCLKAIADPNSHGHIVLVYPEGEKKSVEVAGAAAPGIAARTDIANADGRMGVRACTKGAPQRRSEHEHADGYPIHDNGDFEDVADTRLHDNGRLKQRSENGHAGGHPVHDNGDFEDVADTRLHDNGRLKQRSEKEHVDGRPVHDNGDSEDMPGTHLWDNGDSKQQAKNEEHYIDIGDLADWPSIKRAIENHYADAAAADVQAADFDNEPVYVRRKKLPNVSPDGDPWTIVSEPAAHELAREHEEQLTHAKRSIEVTAAADGAMDLAIPVPTAFPAGGSPAPTPTTLLTVTKPTDSTTNRGSLGAVTIDDTISLAPSTTYPVHRTLSTATLANGTEVRIEQTESQVHDVHVEETAREKGEQEEDRVVVHVRVFVEHVRDRVVAGLKRWVGSSGQKGAGGGWVGEGLVVRGLEKEGTCASEGAEGKDVQGTDEGNGIGPGPWRWSCSCRWYGCFWGYHDDGWM